jgi:hypothetical protein
LIQVKTTKAIGHNLSNPTLVAWMTATVWAIFGGLNKQELVGIDLVLLIVIGVMIWARWRGHRKQ